MGVKSVIDVPTIHAIKGKNKLYANSCKSLDYAVYRNFLFMYSGYKICFFYAVLMQIS